MNTQKPRKSYERFFQGAFSFSEKTIKRYQKETIKRFQNREKTEAYNKFIKWERKPNEIAVFTLPAYADIEIPKKMDCIFRYENPEIYVKENFVISQSISDGWFPLDFIGTGYKHLCILTFEKKVPEIFNSIYCETEKKSKWSPNDPILGLCNYDDLQAIIDRRHKENLLEQLHGEEWYKFDDDYNDGDA